MLIDESGLVRAMKSAWAHGGYNVLFDGEQFTIYCEGWFVRCDRDKIPRKALALLVEHLGILPEEGVILSVEKNEDAQTVIPEVAGEEISSWMMRSNPQQTIVTIVPVTFLRLQIFQKKGGGPCFGVDPIALSIAERAYTVHKDALTTDGTMRWSDDGELVAIRAVQGAAAYWKESWEIDIWKALEQVDLHKCET